MFFKKIKSAAATNQSGAMETRDHFTCFALCAKHKCAMQSASKNGARSKSLMSRGNFKILAAGVLVAGVFSLNTCRKDDSPSSVPKEVINLVSEIGELPVIEEHELKVETVPGKGRTYNYKSNNPDEHPGLTKSSEQVECFAYNTDWTCETKRYTASMNPDGFCMFNPLASVLWPGNLIQGESLKSGIPTSIPVTKRQPGNITLAIVSSDGEGAENMYYRTVEKMQHSYVTQAMNEVLSGFGGHGYAQYNFAMDFIEESSDLAFKLSAGYSGGKAKVSAEFSLNTSDKKQRMLVTLQQSYFTMVYDDPAGLDGVFTPDITVNDLRNYTGNGNPICYISSVTYGRLYYLLYESDASKQELNAALRFSYRGITTSGDGEAELNYKKTMEKTSVRILQIGGDAEGGLSTAMALDLEGIQKFLEKGANFSAKSPGAPISYTVKYLKNAKLVKMNNTLDYEVEECIPKTTTKECPEPPQVTTSAAIPIDAWTAKLGGNIVIAGTPTYYERGVCFSKTAFPAPTISDTKQAIPGVGTESFSYNIDGLIPITTYYVRAYAINEEGIAYGSVVSFTTPPSLPKLITNDAIVINTTSARLGGFINYTGTPAYKDGERGVVYAQTEKPTIEDNKKVITGTGTGDFSDIVTGLEDKKTYYVRAYATNTAGTEYGNEVIVNTGNLLALTTNAATNIGANNATLGGNIVNIGTPPYTERGVVYSTINQALLLITALKR